MMLHLGYNVWIAENGLMLDREFVLERDPNNVSVQKTVPWKEGDIFQIVNHNGQVMFQKLGPLESLIIQDSKDVK